MNISLKDIHIDRPIGVAIVMTLYGDYPNRDGDAMVRYMDECDWMMRGIKGADWLSRVCE